MDKKDEKDEKTMLARIDELEELLLSVVNNVSGFADKIPAKIDDRFEAGLERLTQTAEIFREDARRVEELPPVVKEATAEAQRVVDSLKSKAAEVAREASALAAKIESSRRAPLLWGGLSLLCVAIFCGAAFWGGSRYGRQAALDDLPEYARWATTENGEGVIYAWHKAFDAMNEQERKALSKVSRSEAAERIKWAFSTEGTVLFNKSKK